MSVRLLAALGALLGPPMVKTDMLLEYQGTSDIVKFHVGRGVIRRIELIYYHDLNGRGHRQQKSPGTWVTHVDDKLSRPRPQSACGARSLGRAAAAQST